MRSLTKLDAFRRIDRIVGQGRGLRGMIEEGRGCADVLTQIQSMKGALEGLEALLLVEHIDGNLYGGASEPAGTLGESLKPDDRLRALRDIVRRHVGGR